MVEAHDALRLKVSHLGLDAAREIAKKKVQDIQFEPTNTDLSEPKEGKDDPTNAPHEGGNTWAAGVSTAPPMPIFEITETVSQVGGRDTAGLGGRGGFKRLYKPGHNIKQVDSRLHLLDPIFSPFLQVSDALKDQVPDEIREKAREMAKQELQRRLEELDMTASEARGYGELLAATQAHMLSLHDLLERTYPWPLILWLELSLVYRSRREGRRACLGQAADRRRAGRHQAN